MPVRGGDVGGETLFVGEFDGAPFGAEFSVDRAGFELAEVGLGEVDPGVADVSGDQLPTCRGWPGPSSGAGVTPLVLLENFSGIIW